MRHYLLKDKEVVGPVRFLEWVFNNRFTPVAKTELDNVSISTVFIGIDSAGTEPPLVFETLVSTDQRSEIVRKYSCWQAAEDGHQQEVEAWQRKNQP